MSAKRGDSKVGEGIWVSPGSKRDTYHVAPGAKVYPTGEGGFKVVVDKARTKQR